MEDLGWENSPYKHRALGAGDGRLRSSSHKILCIYPDDEARASS
jgi:hypothetical protein